MSRTASFFTVGFRNFLRSKAELTFSVFVDADRDVAVGFCDFGKRPASFERGSRRKHVFESVSRKTRELVVRKRIDVIVGDGIDRNTVGFQHSVKGIVVSDHRFVFVFRRFLRKRVSVSEIGNVTENGRRNVVQKTCERFSPVVRKVPQYERDADAVIEPGIKKSISIERRPIRTAQKTDPRKPLQNREIDIIINKFRKIRREDTVIRGDREACAFRKRGQHKGPRHIVESIFSHGVIIARFCA